MFETDRAAEIAPGFEIPMVLRAVALMGKGSFFPALESLERAVRINPRGNSGAPIILAMMQLHTGRAEEGVAVLERGRAANSDMLMARLALARHYAATGRPDRVRTLVDEIRAVNPDLSAEEVATGLPGPFAGEAEEFARKLRLAGMP